MIGRLCAALLGLLVAAGSRGEAPPPYTVAPDLFDATRADLGLRAAPGTQTVTIFAPGPEGDQFSNGVVLIPFRDRLYAQWQSSARDEDSPDTWVAYSVSTDGINWSPPKALAPAGRRGRMHSSGGWWTDGRRLVAYINVWPQGFQSGAGGYAEYRLSADGQRWSRPKRVLGLGGKPVDGIIEQDPHLLPGRGLVTAFHLRPGVVVAPFTTDDALGIRRWRRGAITLLPDDSAGMSSEIRTSREIEPSVFLRGGCAVMVFRDQESTFRQLASESCDGGATWTTPVLTDMPDSRAKQSAGNLPDGTAYLVNAPRGERVRMPLVVTLSADGRRFDRAYLLRAQSDLQPLRRDGRYKRPGYHYPKSVLWRDHLYVGYATNKEDVQLTRVPVASLSAR
jgi:hypothetical protein